MLAGESAGAPFGGPGPDRVRDTAYGSAPDAHAVPDGFIAPAVSPGTSQGPAPGPVRRAVGGPPTRQARAAGRRAAGARGPGASGRVSLEAPSRVSVPEPARTSAAAPSRAGRGRVSARVAIAAALLCAGVATASAGLHGADLRRGPLPALARQYARATLDLEVTADPRRTRPRVSGDHLAPVAYLVDAAAVRVRTADGADSRTRTPVLLIVDSPDTRTQRQWARLLPTTRIRVTARLAPPSGDERAAAVARVTGTRGAGPEVTGAPSGLQRFAGRLRDGLRTATDGLAPDARALLPGLVVGDTSRIPPDLDEAFRATDLTHLTAVSGSNLTILLALLIGPAARAQRTERRGIAPLLGLPLRATALLGGVLTLCFVVVCRPEPSVLRAAVCGGVTLLALGTGRRRSLLPALAAAALLLVLYDPWLSRSYGFLLSVLATGALLVLAPRCAAALRRRGVPGRLAEAAGAAIAAQVVCAPVIVVLASRVSLVAVPCNLLAEFAVAPATVLGCAALALAPFAPVLAEAAAWCGGWPAGWLARIARTGAALPGNGVGWPGGWRGGLLLATATGVVWFLGRRLLRRPWICAACGLLLVLAVVQPRPLARLVTGWPPPGWRYVMCDVGQGDASVLAAGDGTAVVVDAGPDPEAVDRCLRALGVTRVPLVLLTHFHADHTAGLPGVLRGRRVGAIETTAAGDPAAQADAVDRQAAARHIPVGRAAAGERGTSGDASWRVLWPPARAAPVGGGPNDTSVVLLVRTAGLTLLLLGDLEPPAQRALAESREAAALGRVDVLKVAHHGSAYQDPDLLRRLAPRLALISCGEHNMYGHPSPRTVAALRAGGARVLRTDRDGALAVVVGEDRGLRAVSRQTARTPG